MAQINRAAAARGLGNSGMAMGAISQAQADIANKFLMSESERQRMAFAAASGQLSNAGQIASQQAQAGYQHAIDAYNAKVQGQQALVVGRAWNWNLSLSVRSADGSHETNGRSAKASDLHDEQPRIPTASSHVQH
jgi:hypothetical protein